MATPLPKNKPSLDNLFDDFAHPNPNINHQACLLMALHWPVASINRLIANLSKKNIDIRRKSVKALGCFGDKALLPVYKVFLMNKDLTIRISCLKVFVKIAAVEKYDSIPNCLNQVIDSSLKDDNPQIVLALVSLLRQLGPQGLPKLIEISRDGNILRAKASVTAIGEIDDPSAENCLKELLYDKSIDQLVREGADYALETYKSRVRTNNQS